MIWFALRVVPQKEFLFQRILREEGVSSIVPIKHVAKRQSRGTVHRQLMAYPQIPGLVFVGFELDRPPNWPRLQRFDKIVLDKFTTGDGHPQEFSPADIVRISGHSQRPLFVRRNPDKQARRRGGKWRPNAEVVAGPYEGRVFKASFVSPSYHGEQVREVSELYELLSTGT